MIGGHGNSTGVFGGRKQVHVSYYPESLSLRLRFTFGLQSVTRSKCNVPRQTKNAAPLLQAP
eukprot:2958728-Pyramimonas_sp.AAC.1